MHSLSVPINIWFTPVIAFHYYPIVFLFHLFLILLTDCLLPLPEVAWIASGEAIPLLVAASNTS